MKVLDLHCPQAHVFEGWFGSEDDFQSQLQRGLVQCPVCGDSSITKRLSAPRLNLGAAPPAQDKPQCLPAPSTAPSAPAAAPPALSAQAREQLHSMQAAWLQWSQQAAKHSEDVGERFAEEARRMHYGETDERAIRGQASVDQALELLQEGIEVLPLALPGLGKKDLQ